MCQTPCVAGKPGVRETQSEEIHPGTANWTWLSCRWKRDGKETRCLGSHGTLNRDLDALSQPGARWKPRSHRLHLQGMKGLLYIWNQTRATGNLALNACDTLLTFLSRRRKRTEQKLPKVYWSRTIGIWWKTSILEWWEKWKSWKWFASLVFWGLYRHQKIFPTIHT